MEPVVVPIDDNGSVLRNAASRLSALVGGELGIDLSGVVRVLRESKLASG